MIRKLKNIEIIKEKDPEIYKRKLSSDSEIGRYSIM